MIETFVRKTEVADLLTILELIQELADYEKMPDGPKLTIKRLIDDGAFYNSSTPLFHSFVAEIDADVDGVNANINDQNNLTSSTSSAETENDEKDGGRPLTRKIVGYSIGFFTFSTTIGRQYFLEDIYVKPEFRRYKIGAQLFKANTKLAIAHKCKRFNLHVLEWNEPAKQFYKKLGATDLTSGENGLEYFRLTQDVREEYLKNCA